MKKVSIYFTCAMFFIPSLALSEQTSKLDVCKSIGAAFEPVLQNLLVTNILLAIVAMELDDRELKAKVENQLDETNKVLSDFTGKFEAIVSQCAD